jgi:SdrD B-like protein
MRGSIVVLALVASPFLANAQGHSPKRTDFPSSAKCDTRDRGNSSNVMSQTGKDNRADPTLKGNKGCAPAPTPPPTPDPQGAAGHSTVTGMLYNDPDSMGAFDGSQFGLGGWTVQLSGPAGILTTTTDGNGVYTFANLAAGSYSLCAVPPGGWINTGPANGVSCPSSSFGYSIDAPDVTFDVLFSDYNFGFKSAPW